MEEDVIEDIHLLQQILQRWGVQQLSQRIAELSSDPNYSHEHVLKLCWERCKHEPLRNKSNGNPNYVTYAIIRSWDAQWAGTRTGQDDNKASVLTPKQGPLSIIFTAVFMNLLMKIKLLMVSGSPRTFHLAVRRFSTIVSCIFTGAYGDEFYHDVTNENIKRVVYLLRISISLILDTQVDRIYVGGALPVRTIFTWARCVVHLVNVINGLCPQLVEGIEEDIFRDFLELVRQRYGTTIQLFHRAMKSMQLVGGNIEMKRPTVTVNDNSLRVVAILISEFVYNCQLAKTVTFDGWGWNPVYDDATLSTSKLHQSGYPIIELRDKVAGYLLDHSLRPLAAVVASPSCILHNLALWQAYVYLVVGYCDFGYKGNFLSRVLGCGGDGGYNSNALLDILESPVGLRVDTCAPIQDSSVTVLRAIRLMQEVVTYLIYDLNDNPAKKSFTERREQGDGTDTNDGRTQCLRLIARTMFVWHLHYYKSNIQRDGVQPHDCDYYAAFFKMAVVTLHRHRFHLPDDIADILISVVVISLNVLNRYKDRSRLLQAVLHAFFRPTALSVTWQIRRAQTFAETGVNIYETSAANSSDTILQESQPRDVLLRLDAFTYTNMKAIVQNYIYSTNRPIDVMKAIYSHLQARGYKIESITEVGRQPLDSLLRRFAKYEHLRKETGSIGVATPQSDESNVASCASSDTTNSSKSAGYAFSKCFAVSCIDETAVVMVCLASEAAIRFLHRHDSMDTVDIACSFVFLNSLALLLTVVHERLSSCNSGGEVGSWKRGSTIALLLETYLHMQTIEISATMRSALRAPLLSALYLSDAVVEVLLYTLLRSQFYSPKAHVKRVTDLNLGFSRHDTLILMNCLRCVIASPIKDVLHVIKTLTFLLQQNTAGYGKMTPVNITNMKEKGLKSGVALHDSPLTYESHQCCGKGDTSVSSSPMGTVSRSERAAIVEKLLIHAMTRYLASVAVNISRLRLNPPTVAPLKAGFFDGILKAVCKFIGATGISDLTYNVVHVLPFLLNLWNLIRLDPNNESSDLVTFCMELESLNRRRHSVAHGIPLLSDISTLLSLRASMLPKLMSSYSVGGGTRDPDDKASTPINSRKDKSNECVTTSRLSNTLSSVLSEKAMDLHQSFSGYPGTTTAKKYDSTTPAKEPIDEADAIPYARYLRVYTAKIPRFCFHCNGPLQARLPLRGLYHITCKRCKLPSPLLCEGQIDLNNRTIGIYVVTQVPITARGVLSSGMVPLASQYTPDVTLNWDFIKSLLEASANLLSRVVLPIDVKHAVSRDLSNILAQWMQCAPEVCHRTLQMVSRLSTLGTGCIHWLMHKNEVYRKLGSMCQIGVNVEFFNSRFNDNMVIMSDSSTEVGQLRLHYFCDWLVMSLASPIPVTYKEEDCTDFWRCSPVLAANLSTTTLSQIFTCLLQAVVDADVVTPVAPVRAIDPTDQIRFASAWLGLSQLANILSIPLGKLLVSGLSLVPVRLSLSLRAMLTPMPPLTNFMLALVLPSSVLERLEDLHEGTIKNVLCTDSMLQFSLEDCDYRLFQVMQTFHQTGNLPDNIDQLQHLDKYRFYALVRLLWYATNPHVMLRMDALRGAKPLLEVQADYVSAPFRSYLEAISRYKRQNSLQQNNKSGESGTKSTSINSAVLSSGRPSVSVTQRSELAFAGQQTGTQHMDTMQNDSSSAPESTPQSSDQCSGSSAMIEYLQENFVRVLEYFVAVWLNRGKQTLNFALKNKRVFYPEIYGYSDKQPIADAHIARTYNCIAILICIYHGDIDVFCDRLIEVLTIRPVDAHNAQVLFHCWVFLARKVSCEVLGLCAPGIAYYVARIEKLGIDIQTTDSLIDEIKVRLEPTDQDKRFSSYIDCMVSCVRSPEAVDNIEVKLEMLASMLHNGESLKIPYITREAAAITANQLLELNPFVSNMEHARASALRLAEAALRTIAEHSDDFSKTPIALATACCSILGYVPCDLGAFRSLRKQRASYVQCLHSDPTELANNVLRDYLIPNMHLQVALYCIQEILKLLGLYKGGVRSRKELNTMSERWQNSFDPVIRRAIEPYRATSFLRNRSIEDIIETCLDVNTVFDIKSFVWWLLKMLPDTCPSLPLFRACDLAMVKIPSVLTFLLPYIVESCVNFLTDEQCAIIGKRVASLLCNILKRDSATFGINWQPPYEVLSKSRPTLDSTDQYTSCQAIFNLLDGIKVLTDRCRHELAGIHSGSDSSFSKRRKLSIPSDNPFKDVPITTPIEQDSAAGSPGSTVKLLRTKMRRLDSILYAVPELLVAHAAISCGSYARGVMIIEKKIALEPMTYNFGDPTRALSNRSLRRKVIDKGGLDPQAIISLLCRGYLGLGDFDSLVCISSIVLNDDSHRSKKQNTDMPVDATTQDIEEHYVAKASGSTPNTSIQLPPRTSFIDKRQREACRAFSYECRGKYREACDVYNRLLKTSQDARLWTSWYRIIQMTGPTVFIHLPQPPDMEDATESLIAESLTACWKLALWDELDVLLAKKRTRDTALLEIQLDDLSSKNVLLVERNDARADVACSQVTQCTADSGESDVFWESLLMRDPIDVWFMEQTANAISHLQKRDYAASDRTVQEGFKHLIRPLGLAIRESTLVAVKYLEKIVIFNSLRLTSRFNNGHYNIDERGFARELTSLVQSSTGESMRSSLNILGTAKVALELGSKFDAASELMLTLNRMCRIHKVDVHIPGSISLDDEAFSDRSDVVLEHALTLQYKGQVDDAIAALKELGRHDFEGFYNLVKMYTDSNMLIPKRAISYMSEILKAAPQSFKANLLYAEYLDRLLDHRLRNARNFRVVLNDKTICARRSVLSSPIERTYMITGIEGVPGIYTFVELVSATVNAYLRALAFITPSRHCGPFRKPEDIKPTVTPVDTDKDTSANEYSDAQRTQDDGTVGPFVGENSPHPGRAATKSFKDSGGNMDIVDILTKVIAIICFYCTPNTSQFLSNVTFENEACQIFANAIMDKFFEHNDAIPQYYWYTVISQLMSRCQHKLLGASLFQTLVARLVARYPKQALWSTLYFAHSVNSHMRQVHINIERKAREIAPSSALIVEYHHTIFKELTQVAMDTSVSTSDKSVLRFQGLCNVLNSTGCKDNVIIPTIRNLSFEQIIHYDLTVEKSKLCGIDENMQVLRSKQKPKRIGFLTVTGEIVNFLVKNEVKGDLRKDKRMMEVTQYVAKMLNKQYKGMEIQCYSVVSLTEVAGIIEWVPNMATMRAVVTDELRLLVKGQDRESRKAITEYATSVSEKRYVDSLKLFRQLCERRPAVLHRVYYKFFKRDPTTWFCARKEYIHTCAVWSILGYIVGLGDRHAENVLLNLITGQMMHVDFDCLFGKGCQLSVPELVPFRMTQNVVCNLGVCGTATDGPFYSEALKFLQMLHKDRHKITSILMSFVFDPLIEWHRGESTANGEGDSHKVLQCIESKLRGALNIFIPSVEINSSHSAFNEYDDASDVQAMQSFESVTEIMEPREQLQKLIQVATSHAHLSKMFVGWAPWL
ncbi:Serine/threonine-protein kinase ATR [Babesia sp. Xinjiang]|uniref:Serine/threonine-protein kinase ATR n=1 Tax=Babesia sp. Xinjiang TaxID=462227 RepID=UPI000A24C8BA|nr:Serine/threonine-protein kinase ATR [Babesia sp. Xinjiang]XP_028872107.1 Serine/threonine-protein kinase ATR [Babesia sp. Xinjiang]ORM41584.1 Serine/threonine-protein kinase ATR [Babesia sp. Xinjiang]ORM41651.1 Serine/threonine-protein kinase ATR [Babesia sp. Xinjiang]